MFSMKKILQNKPTAAAKSQRSSKPRGQASHSIQYAIVPKDLAGHVFQVTLQVAVPDPAGQRFMLPAWIPGSYMVREFARNIVTLRAFNDAGRKVRLEKTDKPSWQAAPVKGALTLRYEVYAWDLSVRAAHLDDTTGFFNGTSVFLSPLG